MCMQQNKKSIRRKVVFSHTRDGDGMAHSVVEMDAQIKSFMGVGFSGHLFSHSAIVNFDPSNDISHAQIPPTQKFRFASSILTSISFSFHHLGCLMQKRIVFGRIFRFWRWVCNQTQYNPLSSPFIHQIISHSSPSLPNR